MVLSSRFVSSPGKGKGRKKNREVNLKGDRKE
jgi:hypothetical protein